MMSPLSSLLLPFYTTLGGLSKYCSLPFFFSGYQSQSPLSEILVAGPFFISSYFAFMGTHT